MLKQTYDDPNPDNRLLTNGKLLELGSFSDVVFKHDARSSLSLDVTFGEGPVQGVARRSGTRRGLDYEKITPTSFSVDFNSTERARRIYIKEFAFYRSDGEKSVSGAVSSLGRVKQWEANVPLPKRGVALEFYHFIPYVWLTKRSLRRDMPPPAWQFLEGLYALREICETAFGGIIHFQPVRTPIKQFYLVTGESPTSVGPTGEYLLGVLYRDEKRRKPTRRNLLKHLDYWLDQKFGLIQNIVLEPITKTRTIYALTGTDTKTRIRVNLASVGFGVSQVAPIIVQGFLSPRNSCLLIEQPEIHLHPNAQADLGDLFIEFANQGKQLLVETHSQYILYRVLRRIAERTFEASRLRVFFVARSAEGSRVEQLGMDQRGRISNWPKGFFEEGYEETAATAEALTKA